MGTYFIRRILLMVPTFIGCTLLVFIILQVTPGGPLEQAVQRLQMGASQQGGETAGGSVSNIMSGGSQILPEKALNDLKRFYGFNKPICDRRPTVFIPVVLFICVSLPVKFLALLKVFEGRPILSTGGYCALF